MNDNGATPDPVANTGLLTSSVSAAALEYADRGWYVFPLLPKRKTPATAHGFKDASADVELVRAWWELSPSANVGIDCGRSGLVVVDLDGQQGHDAWADLAACCGGHSPTPIAETANGLHVYLTGDGPSSTRRLGDGIDTRGRGGYVVAPPSVHPSGVRYRWLDDRAPVAPAPAWLLDSLARPTTEAVIGERRALPRGLRITTYGRVALNGLADEMLGAIEGSRNDTLLTVARRAGRLEAAGELDAGLAKRVLLSAAEQVGLLPFEVEATWRSGFEYGQRYPALRVVQ